MSASSEYLDRYAILMPIASGGMATVYLARARGAGGFEREVAIKKLHPHLLHDAPDAAIELIEEAKLASRIRHPNVVPVLDVGDGPDGVFLVMEYIEGETLSAVLRGAAAARAPLPVPLALRILSDALAGLHAAHELRDERGGPAGLVHRDFSPQNILIGTDGVARLTDFGIAKAANRQGSTQTGIVKGKVGYMAPEQARARPLDRRCDVWAAGVVAWEVFAGQRMYSPKLDQVAVLMAIVNERPPRLRSVRPDVPAALDEAIAWALEGDGAQRCPSAEALRQRILGAWGREVAPADPSELAAHVTKLSGAKLSERRRRFEEAQSVTVPRALPAPSAAAAPEPAEPTVETVTVETATDLSVSVPSARPAVTSISAIEPPPSSAAPLSEPKRAGPGRRGRLAATAAGIAAVAGVALWAGSSLRAGDAGPEPSPAALEPAPGLLATAAVTPSITPAPAVAEAPARSVLSLQADAPIAQLRLGDRVIAVASPSKSITVELLPEERARSLSLEAIAADGRKAVAESVSGDTASVSFGSAGKAAAPPRKRPAAAPSTTGLMASPYEKPPRQR